MSTDLDLGHRVPPGLSRDVVDFTADRLGLTATSELTWSAPYDLVSGDGRTGFETEVRVSRVDLGTPGSDPEHALVFLERAGPSGVALTVGGIFIDVTAASLSAGDSNLHSAVDACRAPGRSSPARNEEVEDLTRRVADLSPAASEELRDFLSPFLVRTLPVLSSSPVRELVGDPVFVRGRLSAVRDAADGVPLTWAYRRAFGSARGEAVS